MSGISAPQQLALLSAATGASQFGASFAQSQAIRAQGRFRQGQLQASREIAEFQAEEALRIGRQESGRALTRTGRRIGSQRVALAAQGIDVGSGTALDIQQQTATIGALDALTIRNNAARQAFGFRVQGANLGTQARLARLASRSRASSTLLTGGLQFARSLGRAAILSRADREPSVDQLLARRIAREGGF